ncbi:hypothetical protein [Bremerella sp. P1]|uniref:hypothetical protein n=1 Tax=Bremerella sp. P1 TaxID=3026424 RepID=UPI00236782CD|nr:hypothetical protein [Bremerella sp. P1]WDI41814.1 hypothetical protein PSR63_25515 [Bremerella sp. P1]
MNDRLKKRFQELLNEANRIYDRYQRSESPNSHIEESDWRLGEEKWFASVDSLIAKVFGEQSPHREKFAEIPSGYSKDDSVFRSRLAIFQAAKEDYDCGLTDLRALISADVFSDELEQAEELLAANYKTPAAVVAGTVLETTIRSLCDKHGIQNDRKTKLDTMNSELAKVGEYNKAKADQVRAWAKIRNSAAHGHPEEFTETDVKLMIAGVRDFVANQLN